MSSTSSSLFDYTHQCDGVWGDATKYPWHPTLRHPFIYYSQVRPVRQWQRSTEITKNKPNCFKKAFRWYTQEHDPFKNGRTDSSISHAELKSFAVWLDEKYDEYLRNAQFEQLQYIVNPTSAVDVDKTAKWEQFKTPGAKKHKGIRSPWKKRRKYLNDNRKENGEVIMKSNQSVEVILNPKILFRSASECCQRTKTQSCCNHSTSTFASNTSALQAITKPMSQSLTSVLKEREVYLLPFDAPVYGVKKDYEYKKYTKKNSARKKTKVKHQIDVSCQCSKGLIGNVDKFSQVENKALRRTNICGCDDEYKKSLSTATKTNTIPKLPSEHLIDKENTGFILNDTDIEKNRTSFLALVSDKVQTSDHSINLNQFTHPRYPLFMKIICSEK